MKQYARNALFGCFTVYNSAYKLCISISSHMRQFSWDNIKSPDTETMKWLNNLQN